jgi:hypothetical protein
MIVSSDIIAGISHDLSRSQEAKRAKKLIFYVSQRYWEADFAIVNSYSFEALLASLYENNPTLDDLKALLYQAVNTLNRKEVYVKIAKYVYQRMSPLYNKEGSSLPSEDNNQNNEFESDLLDRIAENIEYHEESPRIKKLIFAACKQYWENDINVIEMYDIKELLLELYQLYPNPKRLKKALENIVSTINRQNFYSFIADTIVGELTYLYKHETVEVTKDTGNEEETQLIKAKAKNKNQESSPITINQEVETSIETAEETQDESDLDLSGSIIASDVPEGQVIPWLKLENLFDLKHEIMQYTNPLRAKIMLFYAMYQIDISEQHWSIVRTCTLDDLLIRMFQQYGKDIKTIENNLMSVANSSIEGLEVDDNAQTVSAIVESVKHFYKRA